MNDEDQAKKARSSIESWVTQIRPITHVSHIGYVSDKAAGAIRVRYAPNTSAGVSEYLDNSDTSRYAPICRRYAPDTSMIFFLRYFDGFGQEYALDTRRYAPILL
jgi:hypothetical protein